ncbi:mitogen-activated protein kinase 15-like, partial [Heptranchias perlo]|uniref:mitogen-activated protein kinase 15-like n=1 Tax=Heptranchias perlo TaxID=212740 RepID=UPI0035596A9A
MILERKMNVRVQRRLVLKVPDPVKPSLEPELNGLTPAGPDPPNAPVTVRPTQPVPHGERVLSSPTVNITSQNPITHDSLSYAASQ